MTDIRTDSRAAIERFIDCHLDFIDRFVPVTDADRADAKAAMRNIQVDAQVDALKAAAAKIPSVYTRGSGPGAWLEGEADRIKEQGRP